MATRNLQILITAKNRAQKQLNNVQSKMKSMQPTFQKMAVGGAAAATGIGYMGKKALDAAGEAEVVQERFSSVFGKTTEDARKWTEDMAKEYGRATSTMQSTASNVGGQLQMVAGNLPDKEISEMSKNLSEQSIAMSAYYKNIKSSEDASSAMSKALAGQTDRLTEMGYQVGKRSEQFKNMRKELGFTEDQMNSTKEAQVIYNLIMKQNKMVMDAYGKTQNSYQEKQRKAKEQVKKLSETLGNTLIPMIKKFLSRITPVLEKIAQWVKENPKLTKVIFIVVGALAALVAIVGALGLILPSIIAGFSMLMGPIGLVIGIVTVLAAIVYLVIKNWKGISAFFIKVWQGIKNAFVTYLNNIKSFWVKMWNGISKAVTVIWNGIKNFFGSIWEGIKKMFKFYISFVTGLVITIFDAMGIDIVKVFKNILTRLKTAWENIKLLFRVTLNYLKRLWNRIWNGISNFLGPIWENIKGTIKSGWDWISGLFKKASKPLKDAWDNLWGGLKENLKNIWDGIEDIIKSGINWIIGKLNWFIEKANNIASKGSVIPGVSPPQFPKIPKLAEGGIVKKPTLAMVGEESPEAVVPLKNKGNMNGTNINITINGDVSGEEVVDKVKQGLMGEFGFNQKFSF